MNPLIHILEEGLCVLPLAVCPYCVRVMPSSASSIRSCKAWLLTGSCPVPGVEGAGEQEAIWEEDGGLDETAMTPVTGVPAPSSATGWMPELDEAASVYKWWRTALM